MKFRCPCSKTVEGVATTLTYGKDNPTHVIRILGILGNPDETADWQLIPLSKGKDTGGGLWVCRACATKALYLAQQLMNLMGTPNLCVTSLLLDIKPD